jgi:ABC-type amino acid transport substrate-binding protein
MKRFVSLSLLLLPVMFCQAQTLKPITVAEFVHPPFAYLDAQTKEAKGAEIAYLTTMLNDMGYQPTFTFAPFPRMLSMLQSGEADMGSLLTKTADREAFASYSSKPVLTMIPVIVVLKDNPLKRLKTPSDLKGLKIGFAAGQTAPAFFNNSGLPPFDLATGDNITEQNFKKLVAKRFDVCIELNPINVRIIAKTMGITDAIRSIDIPGKGTLFYCIISKKSKIAAGILKGINASLNANKLDFENFLQEELR